MWCTALREEAPEPGMITDHFLYFFIAAHAQSINCLGASAAAISNPPCLPTGPLLPLLPLSPPCAPLQCTSLITRLLASRMEFNWCYGCTPGRPRSPWPSPACTPKVRRSFVNQPELCSRICPQWRIGISGHVQSPLHAVLRACSRPLVRCLSMQK